MSIKQYFHEYLNIFIHFLKISMNVFITRVWFKKYLGRDLSFWISSDEAMNEFIYIIINKKFSTYPHEPLFSMTFCPFIPSFCDQIMLQNNCWKFHKSFWHHCWGRLIWSLSYWLRNTIRPNVLMLINCSNYDSLTWK